MSAILELLARPLLPGQRSLPLLVEAPHAGLDLNEALEPIRALVDRHLLDAGGILFVVSTWVAPRLSAASPAASATRC